MYYSWIYKQEKEIERLKQHGILIGSFTNPEAAQSMIKQENPDYKSTEDLDKSIEFARKLYNKEQSIETKATEPQISTRRRRRRIVNNGVDSHINNRK